MADKTVIAKETSVVESARGQGFIGGTVADVAQLLLVVGAITQPQVAAIMATSAVAVSLVSRAWTVWGWLKAKKAVIDPAQTPSLITSILPK